MRQSARDFRATQRSMMLQGRAARRAAKAVATGAPQPVRTLLVAAGLDDATAKRFAPAFSRGVKVAETGRVQIKLRGRRTRRVDVKLYDQPTFAARLATYRPKDAAAAAQFAALAA